MATDLLGLSIAANLPFIRVKTDDTVYFKEVLERIAGQTANPMKTPEVSESTNVPGNLFYTSRDELCTPKVYREFKALNKTLVFVNTKASVLTMDVGTMLPPTSMILELLQAHCSEDVAKGCVGCFGGVTYKDAFEIIKMTSEREGAVSASGINKTRQSLLGKSKGVTQVDTDYDFYQVPAYLHTWVDENLGFFLEPEHEILAPRGLLFDGPPGTGKTGAAKYLAKELNLPLFRMDVGAMKGKYVGDSEGNLAAALSQLDQSAPCVLLMDEVEKAFSTGMGGGDSGVSSGMLGTILWWLQEHKSKIFTVMTTNNSKAIPPELFREGRIDKKLTFEGLQSIAEAKEFALHCLSALSKKAPNTVTADICTTVKEVLDSKLQGLIDPSSETGAAVAQVKVSELVNQIVKSVIATEAQKA